MAKGVLIHNPSSHYDDRPETCYHFPKMYLARMEPLVGDWILYYESGTNRGAKAYKAMARLLDIRPDPDIPGHFYVDVEPGSYVPFATFIPPKRDGVAMSGYLRMPDGSMSRGRQVHAVQPIPEEDFWTIAALGLETASLPRVDATGGMQDPAAAYIMDQPREQMTVTRDVRDRAFRARVIDIYDSTCAFSGLRFVNGGGRAEVQAAHIRPVSNGGPDVVTNGIALSGTLHWMFDRGLLGLTTEDDILISRHVNDVEGTERLLRSDRRAVLPAATHLRPHPEYVQWHREHIFKQ